MPTFIITANYTQEAVQGLLKNPAGRREVIADIVEKAGGTLKDLYITMGSTDVIAIADMPDGGNAVAVNMAIGASGGATNFTTMRAWTPEEFEDVANRAAGIVESYSLPGS